MAFLYRIIGLSPPKWDISMGGWGFGIELDVDFARRALQAQLSQEKYEMLQEEGKRFIINCGWKPEAVSRNPFNFYDVNGEYKPQEPNHSLLLHYCQVPGNACGLSFDCMGIEKLIKGAEKIEYLTDNVDSINQSMALLSLWLRWFEFVNAGFLLKRL